MPNTSVCADYVSICRMRQHVPNTSACAEWRLPTNTMCADVSNAECQYCAVFLTSLCRLPGSVPKLTYSRHWTENVILSYLGDFLHSDTFGYHYHASGTHFLKVYLWLGSHIYMDPLQRKLLLSALMVIFNAIRPLYAFSEGGRGNVALWHMFKRIVYSFLLL